MALSFFLIGFSLIGNAWLLMSCIKTINNHAMFINSQQQEIKKLKNKLYGIEE